MALQPLFTLKSPRSGSRWLPAAGLVFLAFVVLLSAGCGGQTIIKRSVDGMIIEDSLAGGSKAALVDGGLFTKDGWQPGRKVR